ncbi:MAG TPA: hypothetical protein VHM70_14165 [Polyangiaceae bacterium]|jgi:phospholipase/carboxylesterase|nr:hypothetical protein [Polyangiaceae bacterium]
MLATRISGLEALHTPIRARQPLLIFLHGYATLPEDFGPFSEIAVKSGNAVILPRSPLAVAPGVLGRAEATATWWPVNSEVRQKALARGPRDLSNVFPRGVVAARGWINELVRALRERYQPSKLTLGGFSQGAMLAIEWQLHTRLRADALALMSAGRIRGPIWARRLSRLAGFPVFQSHGLTDNDLSYTAAEQLRDAMSAAGAKVTWASFAAGHETPMGAWRALQRFLKAQLAADVQTR